MDIVTIHTYYDPVAAELARIRLEEAGIRVFLADQMAAAMPSVFGSSIGIRLQVMEMDAEAAIALLSTEEEAIVIDDDETEAQPDEQAAPQATPLSRPAIVDQCPNCQNDRIDKEYFTSFKKLILTLLLLGLPLLFTSPKRTCRKCGYVF